MTGHAPGQRTCPQGHSVRAGARFCPACGASTAPPVGEAWPPPAGTVWPPATGRASPQPLDPAWPPATGPAWPQPADPAWPPATDHAWPQATGPAWSEVDPAWPPQVVPAPASASRRVRWGTVTLVVVAALVLGVGGGAVGVSLSRRSDPATVNTAASPTTPPPTTAPPPTGPVPVVIGVVDITAVRAESRAETVGTVLNEYFSGINNRDIPRALAVMDPAGVVDRNDPRQVQQFRDNVSTTTDTDVVVHWIRADDSTGGTRAGVTFTSRQDARYGPNGQTCSRWSLTYLLSSQFLIVRSVSSNDAC